MKIRIQMVLILLLGIVGFWAYAEASEWRVEEIGMRAVKMALAKLNVQPSASNLACITNAGYAHHNGRSTKVLYDVIPRISRMSLGRGNILPVHCRWGESLWFAFVHKRSEKDLLLTYVSAEGGKLRATEPMNVWVDKNQSFKPFESVLGAKAFAVVTLINGWADDIPEDLMGAALFHDHLCCGVFTGYFTTRFIQKHIRLSGREKYTYIGAPAWCQDDYIIYALNLTPGKHGYYTMRYPWDRPWRTEKGIYEKLGGIVIVFDFGTNTGRAYLLGFNWHEDEFREFVGIPGLQLDWRNQPWLHVWYNRFFLKHLDNPEKFVSLLKAERLGNRDDLDRLTALGTNPLQVILGQDPTWDMRIP